MTVNRYFEARIIWRSISKIAGNYIGWSGMAIMQDSGKAIEV